MGDLTLLYTDSIKDICEFILEQLGAISDSKIFKIFSISFSILFIFFF